jgi:hypothetical protein
MPTRECDSRSDRFHGIFTKKCKKGDFFNKLMQRSREKVLEMMNNSYKFDKKCKNNSFVDILKELQYI